MMPLIKYNAGLFPGKIAAKVFNLMAKLKEKNRSLFPFQRSKKTAGVFLGISCKI